MNKNVLIYTTPRSGSHYGEALFLAILESQMPIFNLGEYFNPDRGSFRFLSQQRKFSRVQPKWFSPGSRTLSPSKLENLRSSRINSLLKSEETHLLKIFPRNLSDKLEQQLIGRSNVIWLQRRNKFEQLLSFLLAIQTKTWVPGSGRNHSKKMYIAEWVDFVRFSQDQVRWNELMVEKSFNGNVYTFEDLLEKKRIEFQGNVFFKDKLPSFIPPARQNMGSKLQFFGNSSEIVGWYRESILNDYFPVDRSGCAELD